MADVKKKIIENFCYVRTYDRSTKM